MSIVKSIRVRTVTPAVGNAFVRKHHYSGKVVPNSQLHFGAFLNGVLHGVMQFGPSMAKHKIQPLVTGTGWNEFIELNRMAFDEKLPKNSESRCLAVALRLLKKHAPQVKWVISFADATSSGHGTIYQAANFVLTQIKENKGTFRMPDGSTMNHLTASAHHTREQNGKAGTGWIREQGGVLLPGFQLRYIYFLDPTYRAKLTTPEVPYSEAVTRKATMYLGMRQQPKSKAASFQLAQGGAVPTLAHHVVNKTGVKQG